MSQRSRAVIRTIRQACWAGLLAAASSMFLGCGSDERLYHLSGTVTYQGKPVPEGYIVFEPDTSQGNSGAPGRSKILNGKFDTRRNDGRGTLGGPHVIRITGFEGQIAGRPDMEVSLPNQLFQPYSVTADLPKEDGTRDFEVPAP